MSLLWWVNHETGDLTQYDSTVTDSGDLSVDVASKLAGTKYGLSCLIDDQTSIYGQKNQTAPTSNEVRYRFYIDPNTLTMANADTFQVCILSSSGPQTTIMRAALRYTTAGGYFIRGQPFDDAGALATDDTAITDAEHWVEVHVERATGAATNDGRVRLWVDDNLEATWSSVDNFDVFGNMTNVRLGAASGIDVGTLGTLYLDELVFRDDSLKIGAHDPGTLLKTGFRVLIANKSQVVIDEIEPRIDRVAWRLNAGSQVVFSLDADNPKATSTNLQYGNRIIILFENGLPPWGGVIDVPQTWRADGTIEVTAYSPDHILSWRHTEQERLFDGNPAGAIFQGLIEDANTEQDMGIVLGTIFQGGDDLQTEHHYTDLSEIITQQLLGDEYTPYEYEIATSLSDDNRIIFTANFFEERGKDVSSDVRFEAGETLHVDEFTYQGPIVNQWVIVGKGSLWDETRPVAVRENTDSQARYDLRQESAIISEALEVATCETIATTKLAASREPWVKIVGTVFDVAPASFSAWDVGDIVNAILPEFGFNGTDINVRVFTREYDFATGTCGIVVEEVRT